MKREQMAWGYKKRDFAFQVGESLESETVKYGHELWNSDPE
jgi:hypothetical protein